MKLASLILLLALTGCTVRGGWPRFLRPGEATDGEMRRSFEAQQLKNISDAKSAKDKAASEPLSELAIKIQKRDGTNFIGQYMGMIAEWSRNETHWPDGKPIPDSVMMFSATSGQLLKWIPYEDFEAIFVDKTRPEYP